MTLIQLPVTNCSEVQNCFCFNILLLCYYKIHTTQGAELVGICCLDPMGKT